MLDIGQELQTQFGEKILACQKTPDAIATLWVAKENIRDVLRYLKHETSQPFGLLYDLTAIDERSRSHRPDQPDSDFTIIYHLLSFERNQEVRLKLPLRGEYPALATITDLWPAANWYEREIWDMF